MLNSSQSCLDNHQGFRTLLQAMSRPGSIHSFPQAAGDRQQALLQLFDTVLDQQASFALLEEDPEFADRVRILTGSQQKAAEQADFLLAPQGSSRGQLKALKRGRLAFPDEGATVVFAVDSISSGDAASGLSLSGPGIKETSHPRIEGLDSEDLSQLQEINSEFPLGIDCIFVDRSGQIMCIPRSTKIGGIG